MGYSHSNPSHFFGLSRCKETSNSHWRSRLTRPNRIRSNPPSSKTCPKYPDMCKHAYVALRCATLRCVALRCYVKVHYMLHIAMHCIALHCIALHCIALHCIKYILTNTHMTYTATTCIVILYSLKYLLCLPTNLSVTSSGICGGCCFCSSMFLPTAEWLEVPQ